MLYFRVKFYGTQGDIINFIKNRLRTKELEILTEIRHDFLLLSCDERETDNLLKMANTDINSKQRILGVNYKIKNIK